MTELFELFQRAADGFGRRVHAIGQDQWHQPTPCTDWDVRTLVNHVAVEQLWVPPLVDGKSVSDVGSSLDGDQLGDDPVGSWDAAVKASSASFGAPGALDGTVSLSRGPMPAADYCWEMTADALIHSWDLAPRHRRRRHARCRARRADLRADPAPRRGARGERHVREADPGPGRRAVADQAARRGGPAGVIHSNQ